jgi:hypothetical protein
MSTLHLKIKIQSLAAEARLIRAEEKKQKRRRRWCAQHAPETWPRANAEFWSLRHHRQGVVGCEARVSLLAYGFLRGVPYGQMETSVDPLNHPDLDRVQLLAARFGGSAFDKGAWEAWRATAQAWLDVAEDAAGIPQEMEVVHG